MKNQCNVPDCTVDATFSYPNHWCAMHWDMWFEWQPGEEEPAWMSVRPAVMSSDLCRIEGV